MSDRKYNRNVDKKQSQRNT